MPIPRDIRRQFYGTHWYKVVRPPILARDGYRCQRCLLAAGDVGYRIGGIFHPVPRRRRAAALAAGIPLITIELHVAHLNHIHGDDRPENLLTMCPRCHILHDRSQHKETRQTRKDGARPLLATIEEFVGRGLAAQAAVDAILEGVEP